MAVFGVFAGYFFGNFGDGARAGKNLGFLRNFFRFLGF